MQDITENPFDPNRELIRRVRYVVDEILKMFPDTKDMKYVAIKTMMYESLKDLARIPDDQIMIMTRDIANALNFISDGSMADLEEALNAGDQ